jgi:hypothetical protein
MNDFSELVVKEIEARGAAPKPRWHFLITRGALWFLATISIVIGGIAFAVADFVFFDNDGMSIAMLQKSSVYHIAQSIPFIWLFVFSLFATSAYVGFRYTRTGYRYMTVFVVLCIIGVSIILGILLNRLDFGQSIHYYLLKHTSFYDALIHSRDDLTD